MMHINGAADSILNLQVVLALTPRPLYNQEKFQEKSMMLIVNCIENQQDQGKPSKSNH